MEWKTIDSAPDDTYILVWVPEYKRASMGIHYTGKGDRGKVGEGKHGWKVWQSATQARRDYSPTHWMPLPKPPTN